MELINVKTNNFNLMSFTIKNIDRSIANALRRTILNDIPTVVIDTDKISYKLNTSSLNNEIISGRLRCVPVHSIDCLNTSDYIVLLNEKNEGEIKRTITTKNLKVIKSGVSLSENEREKIFPKNSITGGHIILVNLNEGEEINIVMSLKCATAMENASYVAASTISFGNSLDIERIKEMSKKKESEFAILSNEDREIELKNWFANDAKRICFNNSFDFSIQTIGVYSNEELIRIAIIQLINGLKAILNQGIIKVVECPTAMDNSYDIRLLNVDYTLGCILSSVLIEKYMQKTELLIFCAFLKNHPDDTYGTLRIAFNKVEEYNIIELINEGVAESIKIFEHLQLIFK